MNELRVDYARINGIIHRAGSIIIDAVKRERLAWQLRERGAEGDPGKSERGENSVLPVSVRLSVCPSVWPGPCGTDGRTARACAAVGL